jgi:hypothetical protein
MIPRPTAERANYQCLAGGNVAELPAIALTLLISLASPCLPFFVLVILGFGITAPPGSAD